MKIFNKLAAGLVFASLSLISLPSHAAHVAGFSFTEQPFTFDATAYGATSSFSAQFIDFSYEAEIDYTAAGVGFGSFAETGMGFFSGFNNGLGTPPINSGLNNAYNMYVLFSALGSAQANGTGIDGTFSSFNVSIFIDPNRNTTASTFTVGAAGGNESKTATGITGDDVLILTGTLVRGGFHVFGGLANGDFDSVLNVTSFDSNVLGGAAFANFGLPGGGVQADINGVNTSIAGLSGFPNSFQDARFNGSGNTSLQSIPEPTSLALLGIGLLGLAIGARRNKKAA